MAAPRDHLAARRPANPPCPTAAGDLWTVGDTGAGSLIVRHAWETGKGEGRGELLLGPAGPTEGDKDKRKRNLGLLVVHVLGPSIPPEGERERWRG